MNKDYLRNRVKNNINNLSILKRIVFNLDTSFGKVTLKRKLMNDMLDFTKIERLIFEMISSLDNCQ